MLDYVVQCHPHDMVKIEFKTTKRISPRSVQALFRRLEWSDWWTIRDIRWYLAHALFVVSAWHGRKLVGLGVLIGDGRINAYLDKLIVDEPYQGQSIGSIMLGRLVHRVGELKPYQFQTDVCEKRTKRLFARFGFRRNESQIMLMHDPTYRRWGPKANRDREERRKRTGRPEPAWRRMMQ